MNWSNVPPRAWFAALGLGSLGVVALGMEVQALLRLAPCPLCIFQRLLYLLIGLLALGGAVYPRARSLWSAAVGILSLAGIGVAVYQSWMQAYPELATECGYADPNLVERLVDWLGMQWPSLFLATGFCSARDWAFLGLSMANWSVPIFAAIFVYVALLGRRT